MTNFSLARFYPLLAVHALVGCANGASNPPTDQQQESPTGTGGGASNPAVQGTPSDPAGGLMLDPGSPPPVDPNASKCGGLVTAAEPLPVDVFIMMDQSGSMSEAVTGGSKWSVVGAALSTFVRSPKAAGLSAGIQYFGLAGQGTVVGTGCNNPYYCPPPGGYGAGNWNSSCTVSDYSKPDVEIAPLPGNAAAITASIGKHGPASDTPTLPALEGAIDHAKTWATAHPGHPTIIILATDGDPNGCASTPQNVSAAAAAGLSGSPSIETFVIGVGASLTSLNQIAAAGGSSQAFIVDTGQDVSAQFLAALDKIRGQVVLPCEYRIPASEDAGQAADFNKVNVTFTASTGPASGKDTDVYRVDDATKCDAAVPGWYYDHPQAPTKIELCPATCTQVSQDSGTRVSVVVGCASKDVPPR